MFILSGFFTSRYAHDKSLAFTGRLAFEQSYSGVDGDSASVAEILALLSALCQLPVRQDLAVTGSVNQFGEVQPIGGVDEKIEGFFETCRVKQQQQQWPGTQGVVIPHLNVKDLQLRADVLEAVRARRFAVYTIQHVDEAMELFFAVRAGEWRPSEARFEPQTVNALVDARLTEFERLAARAHHHQHTTVSKL